MYLLDTDTCIAYLRQRPGILVQRIAARQPNEVRLCAVVKAELYAGALLSRQPAALRARIDAFVPPYHSLPFDDAASEHYARIRADLTARGQLIGPNDLLIAAIALANGLTLVTHNTREFNRVVGLTVEDWFLP
jgi:tRNA(fMet)-specific endonuclease VapC